MTQPLARRWVAAAGIVAPAIAAAPVAAQQMEWDSLPRMELQDQYAGPLRDTIVQRLRDSADGTIC